MKVTIAISCICIILLLLYIKKRESFTVFNYPSRFKGVIKQFRLGINPSTLYPKEMIPKDLRCDPVLDCNQSVRDEDGTIVVLPPIRTKCLGNREEICKRIDGVKSYPLSPKEKGLFKRT